MLYSPHLSNEFEMFNRIYKFVFEEEKTEKCTRKETTYGGSCYAIETNTEYTKMVVIR